MQALREESLRSQMRPMMSPRIQEAFRRGQTLQQDLLSQVTNASETFFIADLPGAEAVAFGAGMAAGLDVIPAFDNWPHPQGVVRSHDTLAALLTFAEVVQKQRESLPESAPGLLLLDSDRLAPYVDESTQFDNRYLASAPGAAELQQRGVKQVMYITPNRGAAQRKRRPQRPVCRIPDGPDGRGDVPAHRPRAGGGNGRARPAGRHHADGAGNALLLRRRPGFAPRVFHAVLLPDAPPMLYYPMYAGGGFAGRGVARGDLRRPAGVRRPNYQARSRPTMFSGRGVGGPARRRTAQTLGFWPHHGAQQWRARHRVGLALPRLPALRVLWARARLQPVEFPLTPTLSHKERGSNNATRPATVPSLRRGGEPALS